MAAPLSLAGEVRRYDRDRYVTVLFAPSDKREALFALYAFNGELARVREIVSESLLGEMRLQWWRDAIDKFYAGGELAHPVAQGLAAAIREHKLTRATFDRLIDARAADLSNEPLPDMAALEDYADGTAGTVAALALEILGERGEGAIHAARHAGVAWALTGLMRAVPFHKRANRAYLPSHAAVEEVAERAGTHLRQARALRNDVPRRARSALLTCTLAEVYLTRLRAMGYDLTNEAWSVTRPAVGRLAWASLTGRY